ncbi:mitochondrial substrate carrier family protein [Capsicum annuum]|uniref:Uncharacterized protein n=2 Tax=Capsicum annuum TaxID=4072 RepID=A0A2G3A2V8_CAPAN|nr:mitochondrial substrate carrier family protein [Capsicum annuum]PHT88552.1 hypothetical protein T459_10658 [Capsicum annuum]
MLISGKSITISSLHLLVAAFSLWLTCITASESGDPEPTPWPEQFHSILFNNNTKGNLQITDLWYDWPNGRNFNIIQSQLGKKEYHVEWDNHTSFHFTLDANKECRVLHFNVGILRPNWFEGAKYLGQRYMDGFLCNVWNRVDHVWYYEDVVTKRPVFWIFINGAGSHVMTFEVGKVLDDPNWQAPVYCFNDANNKEEISSPLSLVTDNDVSIGRLMGAAAMDVSLLL